jgi:sucrose-phosphate synthase
MWTSYANKYVQLLNELFQKKSSENGSMHSKTAYGKKLANAKLFIISDLDGTLVEGNNSKGLKEFTKWISDHRAKVVFGIASGRNRFVTEQAFEQYDLPKPDILICSAGSEIFYTDKFIPDKGWESHINYHWKRKELQAALEKFPGIYLQEEAAQWPFKLSYYVGDYFDEDAMANLYKFLDDHKLRARVLLTDNKYLDLLPFRASKGSAVRYLSYKWKMPLEHFITAGNSGNDKDMLKGKTRGIVVSNYSAEMEDLKKYHSIYFTKNPMGAGVLEGIQHHIGKQQLTGSKN